MAKKNFEKLNDAEYAEFLEKAHSTVQSRNQRCTQEWKVITPTEASEMLEKNNIRNRKHSTGTSSSYASQMYKGEWEANGEPIIISEPTSIKGVPTEIVMNGQHRLLGCVMSGVPIAVLVVKGVPFSVMETLDTGKCRTGKDVLSAAGIYEDYNFNPSEYSRASSIIKKVLEYCSGRLGSHGHAATRPAPTNQNLVVDGIEYSDLYVSVTRKIMALQKSKTTLSYMSKTAMNFVGYYMAWLLRNFGYSKQEVFPFFEKLVTTEYHGQDDDPIMSLRSIFKQQFDKNITSSARKTYGELELYDFFARAWNAYILDEKRGKMSARSIGRDSEKCTKPYEKCEVEARLNKCNRLKKEQCELEYALAAAE